MLYVGRGKECDAHRRQSTEKRVETYIYLKVTFTTVNIRMLGKCNNFSLLWVILIRKPVNYFLIHNFHNKVCWRKRTFKRWASKQEVLGSEGLKTSSLAFLHALVIVYCSAQYSFITLLHELGNSWTFGGEV